MSRGDRHSSKIKENRVGILRGATVKYTQGIISDTEKADIASIVDQAEISDFRPLMYIMPFERVKNIVKDVPIADRAHPLSDEYIIESLSKNDFDIIELST